MKLTKEYENPIIKKVTKVLLSSEPKHKECTTRYISLANRELHDLIKKGKANAFGVAGASLALENEYRRMFGMFIPRSEPVKIGA